MSTTTARCSRSSPAWGVQTKVRGGRFDQAESRRKLALEVWRSRKRDDLRCASAGCIQTRVRMFLAARRLVEARQEQALACGVVRRAAYAAASLCAKEELPQYGPAAPTDEQLMEALAEKHREERACRAQAADHERKSGVVIKIVEKKKLTCPSMHALSPWVCMEEGYGCDICQCAVPVEMAVACCGKCFSWCALAVSAIIMVEKDLMKVVPQSRGWSSREMVLLLALASLHSECLCC